jgi:hypothetical protein
MTKQQAPDSPDIATVTLPTGERFVMAEMTGRDYRLIREVQAKADEAAALDTMLDILERRCVSGTVPILDLSIRKVSRLVEQWMSGEEEVAFPADERASLAKVMSTAAVKPDEVQPIPLATRSTSSRNGGRRTPRGSSR